MRHRHDLWTACSIDMSDGHSSLNTHNSHVYTLKQQNTVEIHVHAAKSLERFTDKGRSDLFVQKNPNRHEKKFMYNLLGKIWWETSPHIRTAPLLSSSTWVGLLVSRWCSVLGPDSKASGSWDTDRSIDSIILLSPHQPTWPASLQLFTFCLCRAVVATHTKQQPGETKRGGKTPVYWCAHTPAHTPHLKC